MLNPMSITVFERMRRVLSLPIVLAFILASIAGNLFGYDAGLMSGSIITEVRILSLCLLVVCFSGNG